MKARQTKPVSSSWRWDCSWTGTASPWLSASIRGIEANSSLIPLEKKLMEKFDISRFIVCTDTGLSSNTNRYFNRQGRKVELEQQLIVTYSIKYRNYLRSIRNRQVERTRKAVAAGAKAVERKRQNDPKRFIKVDHATKDGDVAGQAVCYIDEDAIAKEEQYDGFYAVCTSLEDGPEPIMKVNQRRWEIEECFRIMKSEFQARPVYLKLQDRIVAHFITCFISLIVYRYLERKLDNWYTVGQIIDTLQEMNFLKV